MTGRRRDDPERRDRSTGLDPHQVCSAILIEVDGKQAGLNRPRNLANQSTRAESPQAVVEYHRRGHAVRREHQVQVAIIVEVEDGNPRVRAGAAVERPGIGPTSESE